MKRKVLVLDGTFRAIQVINWQDCFYLISLDKVSIISYYDDEFIQTPSKKMRLPSIIRVEAKNIKRELNLNSFNIFRRDKFKCAYCGNKYSAKELTIDHIVPKSKGGENRSWENLISACSKCNFVKADKTPVQAKMPLLFKAFKPKWRPKLALVGKDYPVEWEDWLY